MNQTIIMALQAISILLLVVSIISFVIMLNVWRKDEKRTTRIAYIIITSILLSLTIATMAYGFRMI